MLSADRDMVAGSALDLIVETLVGCPDPCRRSRIVHNLVQEIVAAVLWAHPDGPTAETLGLTQVADAAYAHQLRMHELHETGLAPGTAALPAGGLHLVRTASPDSPTSPGSAAC